MPSSVDSLSTSFISPRQVSDFYSKLNCSSGQLLLAGNSYCTKWTVTRGNLLFRVVIFSNFFVTVATWTQEVPYGFSRMPSVVVQIRDLDIPVVFLFWCIWVIVGRSCPCTWWGMRWLVWVTEWIGEYPGDSCAAMNEYAVLFEVWVKRGLLFSIWKAAKSK